MSNLASKPVTLLYKPETDVLGIDLGTTNTVCAVHRAKGTKSEVLDFEDGRRIMPSCVEFNSSGNCESSGSQAAGKQKLKAGYVLYDAKRMIGQGYSDKLKLHSAYWAFEVKPDKDGRPQRISAINFDDPNNLKQRARLMEKYHKDAKTFTDALPIGVGIGLVNNEYSIVVHAGTYFPNKVKKRYFTSRNDQDIAHIIIYEGERLLADTNRKLGEIHLDGLPPGPAGNVYVEVTFEFDQNGILTVYAKSQNGREMSFTIDYKALKKEGEPIEDLIRQLESCRVDHEGMQIIDNARNKVLQNVGYIRKKVDQSVSNKVGDEIIQKCDRVRDVLEGQGDPLLITSTIQTLEDDVKKVLNDLHSSENNTMT
ncbi:hypothetical protein FO519_002739 [Halicephalobus sp. NKZ332]|nr:hypothetical protein FO519_002739 [Halicephalobus sp. NKZ332]